MSSFDLHAAPTRGEELRSPPPVAAAAPTNVARLTNLLAALERHHRELHCEAVAPASELPVPPDRDA